MVPAYLLEERVHPEALEETFATFLPFKRSMIELFPAPVAPKKAMLRRILGGSDLGPVSQKRFGHRRANPDAYCTVICIVGCEDEESGARFGSGTSEDPGSGRCL